MRTFSSALPDTWSDVFSAGYSEGEFADLMSAVEAAYECDYVHPARHHLFRALELVAPEHTKVVILGQDPYPTPGNAHGLAFSVLPPARVPGSLQTIFRELERSIPEWKRPRTGNLEPWARQGVLLLNTILTVQSGKPLSHAGLGWQEFTRAALHLVQKKSSFVIFMLWGAKARQAVMPLIDTSKHAVFECSHPSRMAQNRLPHDARFVGSDQFVIANRCLEARGKVPIDWRL